MLKESLKKSLTFLLLLCFLFSLAGCAVGNSEQLQNTSSAVEDETTGQSEEISWQNFSLAGLHYYEDMDVVTSKDQQDYLLTFSSVDIANETISVKGVISHNGEEAYALSASGKLFRSSFGKEGGLKNNVVAAIINSDNELVMLSCLMFESLDEGLLFPANSDFAGKPLMIFVLMTPDKTVLFFSAPLPENFNFDPLYENIPLPDSSIKILIDIPEWYEIPEDGQWPLNEEEAVGRATAFNDFAWRAW